MLAQRNSSKSIGTARELHMFLPWKMPRDKFATTRGAGESVLGILW